MTDYYGLWYGILLLFGALPAAVGLVLGLAWAWRQGRRGGALVVPALAGGVVAGLVGFLVAVLLLRY